MGEGVIKPVALGPGRVNISNFARRQQVRDFGAGKTVVGVSERARYGR
ncbi:MAG: hypothetical protein ACREC0_00380 [Methylocella sp.]